MRIEATEARSNGAAGGIADQARELIGKHCELRLPRTVHFGIGSISRIKDVAAAPSATRAMVVGGSRALEAFRSRVEAEELLGSLVCDYAPAVRQEPTIENGVELLTRAEVSRVDLVIGVGGGSALDLAKVIAGLSGTGMGFEQVVGVNKVPRRRVGLICIPTTAGSGSEASPNAILLDTKARAKRAAISPELIPDAAIVDPALAIGLPPDVTGATGIDALCHCVEAIVNLNAHPMIDPIALRGVSLIAAHLPTAVHAGNDVAARAGVALGSLFGGICLGPANTTAVHALSYPLQGICGVPHGLANAVLLEHVMRFNSETAVDACAAVALALGASPALTPDELSRQLAPLIGAFLDRCQVPRRLRDLGVDPGHFAGLATSAMSVTRLLANNPRRLTFEDAIWIYQEAY